MKKNLKTPTNLKGKRRQGFLRRMRSLKGRQVLRRRRQKGRKRLTL
jgi:large subunit ribosomal protein L34